VLGEQLTPGLLVGFPLVLVGCWLAATGGRLRRVAEPDLAGPDLAVTSATPIAPVPVDPPTEPSPR